MNDSKKQEKTHLRITENKSKNETLLSKQSFRIGNIPKTSLIVILIIILGTSVYLITIKNKDDNPQKTFINFSYASPESQAIESSSMEELHNTIQGFVDDEEIIGAELLVIKNGSIILHDTVGWKDKENLTLMKKNTLFNIRSMTKPITGTAIQLLIDEKRLNTDTKISEYLPSFNNQRSRNITVEQLMTHTSGLPLSIMSSVDEFETLQLLANETGVVGPEFTPGSKFWYSDAGTEVLGAIIELETGQSLSGFVTDRILDPLCMNNTFYYTKNTENDSRTSQIADLYIGGVREWLKYWSPGKAFYPFALGSQGLYCTPMDYARFLAMFLDEGRIGETRFLSSEAINRTLTPVSKMSTLGSDMPYPEGFYKLEAYYGQMVILFSDCSSGIPRVKVLGHSGSDGTYAWAWPDHDLIVLYFTQSRGSSTGIKLESKIDELLIHPELRELNKKARIEYAEYLGGYYANFGPFRNAEFTVTVQNGGLAIDIPNQCVFELEKEASSESWNFKLMQDVTISFVTEDGVVNAMILNQSGFVFNLPKEIEYVEESYPLDMGKYVGVYETEDPDITMKVVVHDGMLALDIPGQPFELDLFPPDEDGMWCLRINPSTAISFVKNGDEIESILFHLPDGTRITRKRVE